MLNCNHCDCNYDHQITFNLFYNQSAKCPSIQVIPSYSTDENGTRRKDSNIELVSLPHRETRDIFRKLFFGGIQCDVYNVIHVHVSILCPIFICVYKCVQCICVLCVYTYVLCDCMYVCMCMCSVSVYICISIIMYMCVNMCVQYVYIICM